MSENFNYVEMREYIEPFLKSKHEEFQLLGIERLSIDDLWDFVLFTIEKKKADKPSRLYQLVNHVMSLSVNDYMNKLRIDMFKGTEIQLNDDLFSSFN
ncbi:post-transcriptional regulator [Terrilactibacillus laevilacticus]|uniref:Post-transcriptional regulator n=1 Tax=Terrilactibacillus laevilacticus TaxID=1380157 RepID=A0ABW5PU86_9BACI|nr:post-transcriptional regulator [Terrilactibacillus laevilacticus]